MRKWTGEVTYWKADRGYGFVRYNGRESVFLHVRDLPIGSEPDVGDEVEFEIGEDDRVGKPRAINARIVTGAA